MIKNKIEKIPGIGFITKGAAHRAKMLRFAKELISRKLFIALGHRKIFNTVLVYIPDSIATFNAHPELYTLEKRFLKQNKENNGGDLVRLWFWVLNIKKIISDDIPGHFAELGVWRGNTAAILAHYGKENGRTTYLFDTFEGFHNTDLSGIDQEKSKAFEDTTLEIVRSVIGDTSSCKVIKGWFPESTVEMNGNELFSVVSLDCDLYQPMKAGLEYFYPRLSHRGILLLHDYSSLHWEGAKQAIDEFCIKTGESLILMPDKSGSAILQKRNI